MSNTTVLIADDHQIVRQGLRSLLDSHPDLSVVGEAADGRAAIEMARQLKPDVVVMDVGMPDLNGIDATRQVSNLTPAPQVVALSMHADRRFAGEMLRAGAKAYVLKESAFEELASAIREAMQGKVFLSPRIAGVVVEDYASKIRDKDEEPNAFSRLSPREREVLQLMSEGRSTKEIARDLGVSVKTVETHRRQLMTKLNLYTVAELTKYAVREGLTALS